MTDLINFLKKKKSSFISLLPKEEIECEFSMSCGERLHWISYFIFIYCKFSRLKWLFISIKNVVFFCRKIHYLLEWFISTSFSFFIKIILVLFNSWIRFLVLYFVCFSLRLFFHSFVCLRYDTCWYKLLDHAKKIKKD